MNTDFSNKLLEYLFKTQAIKVCDEKNPFWYTSGTIGPYYINTHFLYGSEYLANGLLNLIDTERVNYLKCPISVLNSVLSNYNSNKIYKDTIDDICGFIKNNINLNSIDFISGGERRDWFFSFMVAKLLNKPHLAIYKDLSVVLLDNGETSTVDGINGKNVLHIADLVTEASSYKNMWIPAISKISGNIKWNLAIVDRKQGGEKFFSENDIYYKYFVGIDIEMFKNAFESELISKAQFNMIDAYIKDPKGSMQRFISENPEFIERSLNGDEKTKKRALYCLDNMIYNNI